MDRTDKECAQELVAIELAAGGDGEIAKRVMQQNLTRDEMARGAIYIQTGQKVTGPGR